MVDERTTAYRGKVGALVVGGEHPGLGVVRSLGRRGVPVVVVDDQQCISSFSRYVDRVVRVADLRDERRTVDAIIDVGRRFDLRDWVLFPTRDETVAAFARYRDELKAFFKVTTPDWNTTQWAWDKKKTYELATRLDIPCPRTFNPRTPADPRSASQSTAARHQTGDQRELFLRHRRESVASRHDGATTRTVRRSSRVHQARRDSRATDRARRRRLPVSYCAFFRDGEAHSTLLARRERQHPREFGRAATYVETVDVPLIEELSGRFLKAIDYYGLVEIEFKQDPRDEAGIIDGFQKPFG